MKVIGNPEDYITCTATVIETYTVRREVVFRLHKALLGHHDIKKAKAVSAAEDAPLTGTEALRIQSREVYNIQHKDPTP